MSELKEYELKDGAYGMYLAEDGFPVDEDVGSFFYPKEQVDKVIAELKQQIEILQKEKKILQRIGNGGQVMNHRDVTCPNCGTVYAVGYSDVPHSVENIHRICDTCMMPIEVKNPWNDKER